MNRFGKPCRQRLDLQVAVKTGQASGVTEDKDRYISSTVLEQSSAAAVKGKQSLFPCFVEHDRTRQSK